MQLLIIQVYNFYKLGLLPKLPKGFYIYNCILNKTIIDFGLCYPPHLTQNSALITQDIMLIQ